MSGGIVQLGSLNLIAHIDCYLKNFLLELELLNEGDLEFDIYSSLRVFSVLNCPLIFFEFWWFHHSLLIWYEWNKYLLIAYILMIISYIVIISTNRLECRDNTPTTKTNSPYSLSTMEKYLSTASHSLSTLEKYLSTAPHSLSTLEKYLSIPTSLMICR